MATEVGKGFVEVVADLDKFGASVSKGMSGQQAAFAKSGSDAGKSFGTGVEKELGGKQSIFSKFGTQQGAAFSGALSGALVAGTVGAGVAIAGFAVKAVGDFQKTALAADKFRDTTGLALDQSSRWIAVADDVGVSADTIEGAFKKMQVSIDKNRAAFGDLIVTTASGATDLTATFLNVVEHIQGIEDPIDRANEATKLFGRGFGEVSQIITTDAETLRESLSKVSDEQIITEEEVQKARDLEAALDTLTDTVGDVGLALGKFLAGPLSQLAAVASKGIDIGISITDPTDGKFDWLAPLIDTAANALVPVETVKTLLGALGGEADKTKASVEEVAAAATRTAQPFTNMATVGMSAAESQRRLNESFGSFEARAAGIGQAMDDYAASTQAAEEASRGLLNAQLSLFDSTFAVAESQRAFNEAAIEANSTTGDQTVAFEDAAQAALRVASATVTYAEDQATLKGETLSAEDSQQILISTLSALAAQIGGPVATQLTGMVTQLQTVGAQHPEPTVSVDDQATQPIANIKGKVDGLDAARASITINADGNANSQLQGVIDKISRINGMRLGVSTSIPGLAAGITNFAGGLAVVGEEGPELVHLPAGTTVHSAERTRASISAVQQMSGGLGARNPIVIVNQGTFLGTEEAFGKLADRAIAQARRSGHRVAA